MCLRVLTLAVTLLFVAAPLAALAEPVGTYDLEGDHPDLATTYKGTVTVRRTGSATYQVTWQVNGDQFVGTAIGDDKVLAVNYSGPANGVALFRAENNNTWIGLWTPSGSSLVGNEIWRRR